MSEHFEHCYIHEGYLCSCGAAELSRVQAIEAAEDHADQVVFDAWRERS